jgi:hypothetical protein
VDDTSETDGAAIAGLLAKRDQVERWIASLEGQLRARRGDLAHLDHVLRLFAPDLVQARYKASVFVRSVHFQAGEMTRRCQDALREADGGYVTTEAIVHRAMQDKGLDATDRRLRDDFGRRFTWALNTMLAQGKVRKIGSGMGARWSLPEIS